MHFPASCSLAPTVIRPTVVSSDTVREYIFYVFFSDTRNVFFDFLKTDISADFEAVDAATVIDHGQIRRTGAQTLNVRLTVDAKFCQDWFILSPWRGKKLPKCRYFDKICNV